MILNANTTGWDDGKVDLFLTMNNDGVLGQIHNGIIGKSHTRTGLYQDKYLVMEICRNVDMTPDCLTGDVSEYVLYVTGHSELPGVAAGMVIGGSYEDFICENPSSELKMGIVRRLAMFVYNEGQPGGYCTIEEFNWCMREIQYSLRMSKVVVNEIAMNAD